MIFENSTIITMDPERRIIKDGAIAVTDDHHRRGIGDLLLKRLSEIASSQGIEEFEMLVPEENKRRIEAVESTGRVVSTTTDFGIARLVIRTG